MKLRQADIDVVIDGGLWEDYPEVYTRLEERGVKCYFYDKYKVWLFSSPKLVGKIIRKQFDLWRRIGWYEVNPIVGKYFLSEPEKEIYWPEIQKVRKHNRDRRTKYAKK